MPLRIHFSDSNRLVRSFWYRYASRDGRWTLTERAPLRPEASTPPEHVARLQQPPRSPARG